MLRAVGAACALVSILAPPAAADGPTVVSRCEWALKTTDDGRNMLLVLAATAEASGGSLPGITTTVRCVVTTAYRETVTASATSLGPRVYAVSSRLMRYDPPIACSTSEALWLEGTTIRREAEEEHCVP